MNQDLNSGVTTSKTLDSVLLLSVRGFRHQAANSSLYEFEDVISGFCDATLCCPVNERSMHRKCYRSFKSLGLSHRFSDRVSAMAHISELEAHHDLILLVLDNPWQMHLLNQLKGWRDHPAKKVCYISECWPRELTQWRLFKEPFNNFDHVFLGMASSVALLREKIDVPCSYLPCGVNTEAFFDQNYIPNRVIDVSYIGRRENALHNELKQFAETDNAFYLFDTAKSQKLFVDEPAEHRKMYSSLLQRTRISIALPAKSNLPTETGGIDEIATRFFEFAAAGVVVVGRTPDSDAFRRLFDWQDSVIDIGSNYRSAPDLIRQILDDQHWMNALSTRNIIESSRRNDWVFRFRDIAESVGFVPNSRMVARICALECRVHDLETT